MERIRLGTRRPFSRKKNIIRAAFKKGARKTSKPPNNGKCWTIDWKRSLVDGARPRSLPAGGYEPPCRPRYTVKRSIFTPTQIWYHCVRTIFVHVGKIIPLRSMHSNSRYQHLKVLSERVATILFHVDISGLWNLRTLNSVGTLLLVTFFYQIQWW